MEPTLENVLVFDPQLAKLIGLNEAIVFSQVEYWIGKNKEANRNFHEKRYWTFNTYQEWQETNFFFFSLNTVIRAFKSLEKLGLLIATSKFNKKKYDNTKWYSINYEKLEEVLAQEPLPKMSSGLEKPLSNLENPLPNLGSASTQIEQGVLPNLGRPIPEITPETTTEITKEIKEEEEEKEKLKKEKVFSSSELKFKSSFSEIEIQQAKKFVILNLMLDVKKELNWSDDFYNRFICYMTMANTKFISTKQIRTKNIEIEKNHGKDGRGNPITDRAFYIVKGITMKQQSSDADRQAYLLEKAEKEQAEKFRKEMLQLEGVENVILAENGDAHIIFTDEMAERRKKAHEQYFRDLENGNIQYNLSDYATETLNEQDIY